MDMVTVMAVLLALVVGLAIGVLFGARVLRREQMSINDHIGASTAATAQVVAPVRESLDRFDARLRELEASRVEWHAQLREQVESVRLSGEALRRETASLSTALRKPQVRGRWGEMHLQRAVEVAGLVECCDFTQQDSVRDGESVLRPDMVVHLAGGKQVVVDSKVPLDAFLDATTATDPALQDAHLARHAAQLRSHVDELSAKAYWKQFDRAPEFVVLFVPGEAFLSHALDVEPGMIEYAAGRKVILSTPTTLIALLRTVAYAWSQESLADGAREVQALGREIYDRLGTLGGYMGALGRSLTSAVGSYNKAVGSLETRVLVSARRLRELGISEEMLESPAPVDAAVRPLAAAELVVDEEEWLDRHLVDGGAGDSARRAV